MSRITINGFESFEAWRAAGFPGARSFNQDGSVKDSNQPPVPHRSCSVAGCDRWGSAPRSMCWMHYNEAIKAGHRRHQPLGARFAGTRR